MKRVIVFVFALCIFAIFFIFGISNLSKKNLNQEEFIKFNLEDQKISIKFQNEESSHFSSFSQRNYECIGSCFCDEQRSTSSAVFFSKSLRYLIAASTSFIAYKSAEKYFGNVCIEKLESSCHLESIKSKVEDCSTSSSASSISESSSNLDEKVSNNDEESESITYTCYGNCVDKSKKKDTVRTSTTISCHKLKKEGDVIVHESELIAKTGQRNYRFHRTAKNKFARELLSKFCKENSKVPVFYAKNKNSYNTRNSCVAFSRGNLKNVKCKQISPPPKTHFIGKNWWSQKQEWKES